MSMLMMKPRANPNQYFSQSKLANCLKDIVAGTADIRVILNVRPEKEFLQNALESMRFAERAKCIPTPKSSEHDRQKRKSKLPKNKDHDEKKAESIKSPQEILTDLCVQLSPGKIKLIHQQAEAYFEEKLGSIETMDRSQVKIIFENFIEMWNHLWENETKTPCAHKTFEIPTIEIDAPSETVTPVRSSSPINIVSEVEAVAPSKKEKTNSHHHHHKSRNQPSNNSTKENGLSTEADSEARPESASFAVKKAKKNVKKNRSYTVTEIGEKKPIAANKIEDRRKSIKTKSMQASPKTSASSLLDVLLEEPAEQSNKNSRISNPRRSSSNSTLRRDTADTDDGTKEKSIVPRNHEDMDFNTEYANRHSGALNGDEFDPDFPIGGAALDTEIPARGEAMQMFIRSAEGETVFQLWTEQQSFLKATAEKNTKVLRAVSNVLSNLNRMQADLDVLQQERHINGERYDEAGHVWVSEDEKNLIQELKVFLCRR